MKFNLTAVIASIALAASPAFAADPLKIGLVLPMSGPFAAYGKQIEHGVKLYLTQNGDRYHRNYRAKRENRIILISHRYELV